jgi:hypothetical protein
MSDGMIERVARAIAAALYRPQPDMSGDIWRAVGTERKRKCEDAARAAIEAMREPTDLMALAGYDYCSNVDAWRAMIDAALGERQ